MGIESFFRSIEQNNITNLQDNFTYKLEKRIESDYLLMDYNSVVHITSSTVITDLNYMLYQIINKTFKNNHKFKQLKDVYGLDINADPEYTDLINLLTHHKLDNIILEKVEEYTLNIIKNFVEPNKLKYLLIAIDGVPHKSKMLEQKKRRYMGTIINELKDKIFHKYEESLEHSRQLYEKNKFVWNKINISPGTPFMGELNKLLSSNEFKQKVSKLCPNLIKYLFSGQSDFGEGEKKIVDYVYDIKEKNDLITVYSPDSDMTLLCLILSDKYENINILRYNQQEINYDIINLKLLRKNLYNYVKKTKDIPLNETNIINDIVFVLTIFGNDFLPKMEPFNVKYDFTRIIDKYVETLDGEYIISNRKINQKMFLKVIKVLREDEGANLQKIYIASHYRNYDKLKKLLGATQNNFTEVMAHFLDNLRKFNNEIRQNKLNINHYLTKEQDFINKMIRLTQIQHDKINPETFIKEYVNYYKNNNKFMDVRVTFKRYSKSLKSEHHKVRLEKTISAMDSKLKPTEYDEEIFKLDNMLDEYSMKFNAMPLDLGRVSINPKTYAWYTEPIEKGVKKYYFDFFGLQNINIKNLAMGKLIHEYIQGLTWVFDYYFDTTKRITANVWFYSHTHAPLLTQIYNYMKDVDNNYLEKIQEDLEKYKVDQKDFFKEKEHLIYVTPIKSYPEIIPKEYKEKINKPAFDKYIIDIHKIVDELWTSNTSDEIDCRGIIFLNKCHVTAIHLSDDILKSYEDDKHFMKLLRN
jgi:5'-3' exonuclease